MSVYKREGLRFIAVKDNKKQEAHFNLSEEDRLELHLKNKEKSEQAGAVEEVFKKLNDKYKKKKQ